MLIFLVKKRSLMWFFSGILFAGLSFGAIELAGHPMLVKWQKEKVVISRANTDQLAVALTFDDGPESPNTPAVLDALKRNNARGTFFILGKRAQANPELVRRMVAENHEVGSHSYDHTDYNKLSTQSQLTDIQRSNSIIQEITGRPVVLFRPPGGYLSIAMVEGCRQAGLTIAYWTYQQDSKDWRNGVAATQISKYILAHLEPGQIIILHDGAPNGMATARALDLLIPELKKRGYECLTFSQLTALEKK
ncbi:MAG TPA: polysaccharide deacetylase family protein [Syntrophomonadaceae bacterium]|nr:polysaccharide deacetylase family protein [Syntrophomonadaceae bacterium]